MAYQDKQTMRSVRRLGMGLVNPDEGIHALSHMMRNETAPVVAAIPFNWTTLTQQAAHGALPSIMKEMLGTLKDVSADTGASQAAVVPSAIGYQMRASTTSTAQIIQNKALLIAQSILGAPIDVSEPLMAAGLDSLASVEFRNEMEACLSISLPATLIFDHPTIAAIAAYISAEVQEKQAIELEAASTSFPRREVEQVVMAAAVEIIGAGILADQPLMAGGLDSLGAVELRNALQGRLGLELPSTLVFDYPTVATMATFIAEKLQPPSPKAVTLKDHHMPSAYQMSQPSASGLAVSSMAIRSAKVG